ncbi:MAG: hypothetical protein ACKOD9_05370 [Rubrivivax sp.]
MHRWARRVVGVCLLQIAGWSWSVQAQPPSLPPESLASRFEQLRRQGAVQLGQKPVFLQSTETRERLEGEVIALIEHPAPRVRAALAQAGVWCDILILHLNVKFCRAMQQPGAKGAVDTLQVGLGRKFDEPLASVHWLDFGFRSTMPTTDPASAPWGGTEGVVAVELLAPEGPLDTRDIRIHVQTADAGDGRTLLRLRYAYAQGPTARWAMQFYLGTLGRHKVGFSLVPQHADPPAGPLEPVTGVRGLLERNTVHYYLAVNAYLDALAWPPDKQLERRLLDWFAATERHPRQLRELDWETYVQMKRLEVRRQQSASAGRP